jgi:hypothetical protein
MRLRVVNDALNVAMLINERHIDTHGVLPNVQVEGPPTRVARREPTY